MKLFLLKVLLQRRNRDEGFTLPMVIALGLVMILLGTTNIVKSSEENLNASIQNSSSDALAVAEVGIAKYRELLNQNRILTIYNHDQWNTNAAIVGADTSVTTDDQTCDDMTTTPLANDTTQWWEIREDLNNDGDTTDDDDLVGRYRLVSYEYDIDGNTGDADNNGVLDDTDDNGAFSVISDANTDDDPLTLATGVTANSIADENDTDDDGESDAVGILTVQGQSPDGSEAQIQVDIPLRINDLDNLAPLLWIGGGSITNAGGAGQLNLTDGNIVISRSGGGCANVADIDGNNVVNEARSIPAVIGDPTSLAANQKNNATNGIGSISLTASADAFRLPRTQSPLDNKTSNDDDGRFLYELSSISVTDKNLITDGTAKVTLYVNGNISFSNSGTMRIGQFNGATTNISSHNLEIYGSASTSQIAINTGSAGDVLNIEGFIHAPSATLQITGNGTLNINGAVWVNDYDNQGSAVVNIARDRTDTTTSTESSYKFYTSIDNRTPRPVTSSPSNWVKEEVQ